MLSTFSCSATQRQLSEGSGTAPIIVDKSSETTHTCSFTLQNWNVLLLGDRNKRVTVLPPTNSFRRSTATNDVIGKLDATSLPCLFMIICINTANSLLSLWVHFLYIINIFVTHSEYDILASKHLHWGYKTDYKNIQGVR